MATSTNVVLSDFGLRMWTTTANQTFANAVSSSTMKEVEDVIGVENILFSRDSQEYPILANGGWKKRALLSFNTDDMNINLVRSDEGAYNVDSTYSFFLNKLKEFKANNAFFGIVIARPVSGNNAYEGVYWNVFCSGITDDATNDSGREYTVSVSRSGEPITLDVTYTAAVGETPESFSFVKHATA